MIILHRTKKIILAGFLLIGISAIAGYLIFKTKNETTLTSFQPINEISDKDEIDKLESNNLSAPGTNNKTSPAPDTSSPEREVTPDIHDLQDKPEPVRTLLDPRKDDTKRNEVANSLRDSGYKGLTDDLITVLSNPNEKARFRSFAVQHLFNNYAGAGESEKRKIREVFYKSLNDRHVEVRREALLALVRIGDPKGKETAVAWVKDPDKDNVRDLAIRCVKLLDLKQYMPTIRQYLYDKNEVIRIAAIVALSQWGDKESRSAFEKAADSKSVRLQRAGKAALKRLDEKKKQENHEKEKNTNQSPTERVVF